MAYRDDRQALALQVAELERENEKLREDLGTLRDRAKRAREKDRDSRRSGARRGCVMCGGSLHAVAVFAGKHDAPVALQVSTPRFSARDGGFSRSAPVKALACSSCGFIHNFFDIEKADPELVSSDGELDVELALDDPEDADADAEEPSS